MVAEWTKKTRQAITMSRHVVTWPAAVHTLRAGLTAVVPIKAR